LIKTNLGEIHLKQRYSVSTTPFAKKIFVTLFWSFLSMSVNATTLTLDATAKTEVANDEMLVVLAVERDGTDLSALNQTVLAALNSAIAEAKKSPGIKARTGSVTTNPNWNKDGKTSGWKVRGEVILTSQQLPTLGNLIGQLGQKMQISDIQFRLSDQARAEAEKQLLKQVADLFKSKSKDATQALGFTQFNLKELNLSNGYQVNVRPMMRAKGRSADMASMSSAPAPSESGESEVSITISGSIELK
jgi:predicted secreted protein